MNVKRRHSGVWFHVLLAAGAALAIAMLVQTVVNYRYVSNSLTLQEARRVAEERVRNVERTARLARPQDPDAFRVVLDDIRADMGDQLAAIALLYGDGTIVASSGQPSTVVAAQERGRVTGRDTALAREWRAGREVVFVVFPCRCGLPRQPAARADGPQPSGRRLLEVGLYRDTLSAPFARLRRDATISSSAALALLVSVLLIATGSGAYVRGKQLEIQMDLARQVQRDLLPAAESRSGGMDMAAECRPAWQVGGDFYDIVTLPGDRMSFVLGDVSGHGVSSALLMALIHGAMSAPPWGASNEDPDCAAARLNELLLAKSSGERFASLFWCVYDPASRLLRYVNAGHLPAVWLHRATDGRWVPDRLTEGGPVLGVLDGARYHTASVQTADGDLLVLFSDGITEATNDRDEQFGEDRLIVAIQHSRDLPARGICDAITAAVKVFGATRPPEDDQTLLVVRLQANLVRSPDDRVARSDRGRPGVSRDRFGGCREEAQGPGVRASLRRQIEKATGGTVACGHVEQLECPCARLGSGPRLWNNGRLGCGLFRSRQEEYADDDSLSATPANPDRNSPIRGMVRSVLLGMQGHGTRSHADVTDRDRDESSRREISAWVRTNPQTQVR